MKKGGIVILVLLLLLLTAGASSPSEKIQNKVYQQLEKNNETRVIVELNIPDETGLIFKKKLSPGEIDEERDKIKEKIEDIVGNDSLKHEFNKENIISLNVNNKELKELEKNNDVKSITVSRRLKVLMQNAVEIINASKTWAIQSSGLNITGIGETICIIDTGINYSNPDLGGCFGEGCKVIGGYDYGNNDNNPMDANGHGTHVAGIAAASGGLKGMAPGAKIVAIKVFSDSGTGLEDDLKAGIDWCVNNASALNISVITISLGITDGNDNEIPYDSYCDSEYTGLASSINSAIAKNISVTIAAGNNLGTSGIDAPACIRNATAVGAVDKSDNLFYNRNGLVKLLGIGVSINSTCFTGGYCTKSGTSMATPMVAGTFALVREFYRLQTRILTPQEIQITLNNTGKIIQENSMNYSRIDVYSSILSLDETAPNVTLSSPTNSYLNLAQNRTFSCNATDWQLKNITFYIWNSTGIFNYSSLDISGTFNQSFFNVTNLARGEYKWTCLATDIKNNFAFAQNFSFTISEIQTLLVSPNDNNFTNQQQNFTCLSQSEENSGLENVTFYLWNSSSLFYSESKNVTGIQNSSLFSITLLQDNYKWNCLSINNHSNSSWAINFSLTYDLSKPNITLISPAEGYSASSGTLAFLFNASDNLNITRCDLMLNNAFASSNYSMNSGSISYTISAGSYSWQINCSDEAGNVGNSTLRSLIVTSPAITQSSSGGSSGGGGGSYTAVTEKAAVNNTIKTTGNNETNKIPYENMTNKNISNRVGEKTSNKVTGFVTVLTSKEKGGILIAIIIFIVSAVIFLNLRKARYKKIES